VALALGAGVLGPVAQGDEASRIQAEIERIELERAAIQQTRKAIGMLKQAGGSIRDDHCLAHWSSMQHHLDEKERLEKLGGPTNLYGEEVDEQIEAATNARNRYEKCFQKQLSSNTSVSEYQRDYGARISDYAAFINAYRSERRRYADYGGSERFYELGVRLNELRARLNAIR
jgi:hypothetical protein